MKSFAELVDSCRRLHLLDAAQLDQLARQFAGQNPDPRSVAKKLVEQGWLSHYQANQLFKGKGHELLLGSYVLLEVVGEGGMGVVYKARNWKLGQIVAVKLVLRERLANPNTVKRFQREIRASAQLDHPNIVRTIDADEVSGTNLLVMEYVADGQSLHQLVREQGPLPIELACRYVQQVALGLQHAFERGLVHRDIKPHNLLVAGIRSQVSPVVARSPDLATPGRGRESVPQRPSAAVSSQAAGVAPYQGAAAAGQAGGGPPPSPPLSKGGQGGSLLTPERQHVTPVVKILDFGLARLEQSTEDSSTLTQEGSVMGTLDYLAPEQARDSHTADIRADLYSLGCTMYYMLTGHAPFVGGTAAEKMIKHQFDEPPALEQVRSEAPAALGDIVRKLMAKLPENRYQTPAELALDLDAVLSGRPTSATPPLPPLRRGGLGGGAPASSLPMAVPLQALQETENPFAALSTSETAADTPISARYRTARSPSPAQKLRLMLSVGGASLTLVLALVTIAMLRSRPGPPEPVPKAPPPNPVAHSTLEERIKEAQKLNEKEEADEKKRKADEEKRKADEERAEQQRLADQELVWQQWPAAEELVRGQRAQEAEAPFQRLEAKFQEKGVTFASFAREVAAFKNKHGGTPSALRAAALLGRLRAPLDELDPAKLPSDAQAVWRAWSQTGAPGAAPEGPPKELVAVRGDHRGRHWGPVSQVLFAGSKDKVIVSASGNILLLMAADSREVMAVIPQADVWTLAPGGKLLAAGSFDGTLQVFDVDAAKELWSKEAFAGGGVRSLCFSPDAQTLATGGGLNRAGNSQAGYLVRLWDVATGKPRGISPALDNQVVTLVYSSDGSAIASGTANGTVNLFNARKLQEATPLPGAAGAVTLLFSPDGKTLAAQWPPKTVKLFDVITKKVVLSVDDLIVDGGPRGIFTNDSRGYAYRESNGTVHLWELPKGQLVRKWEAHKEGGISAMGYTRDGKELWTASGLNSGDVKIWDPQTGAELKSVPKYEANGAIDDIRMSPDGKVVAWLCAGKHVRLWRRDQQALQATIHRPESGPFAFSADARRVVTGDFNIIRFWDATTGLETQRIPGRAPTLPSLAFAPDGRLLLAADSRGIIYRWQFGALGETDIIEWQCPPGSFDGAPQLAFLADAQRFTTLGKHCHLMRWNLSVESPITPSAATFACCVTPNARFELTNTADGNITVWDIESREQVCSLATKAKPEAAATQPIIDVAVTPDERFALVLQGTARPRLLRLCSLKSGKEVFRFKPHDCGKVAISPDGQHVVTTDPDGALSLWDLHAGTFLRKIDIGPGLADLPALFSPDGKAAAVFHGSTVVLLEMPSGNELKKWQFPGPVHGLAFAPDSRHLAVANGNGTVYILRLSGGAQPL